MNYDEIPFAKVYRRWFTAEEQEWLFELLPQTRALRTGLKGIKNKSIITHEFFAPITQLYLEEFPYRNPIMYTKQSFSRERIELALTATDMLVLEGRIEGLLMWINRWLERQDASELAG
ncbi:hypothetical protein RhiJN_16436 [Ceratobasidium sp. AG-Ba]|nr:hypothetical protein RhiJN_16436 [Ceratobasidium sp. AG-Ba]